MASISRDRSGSRGARHATCRTSQATAALLQHRQPLRNAGVAAGARVQPPAAPCAVRGAPVQRQAQLAGAGRVRHARPRRARIWLTTAPANKNNASAILGTCLWLHVDAIHF